jgi:hypothetical protein
MQYNEQKKCLCLERRHESFDHGERVVTLCASFARRAGPLLGIVALTGCGPDGGSGGDNGYLSWANSDNGTVVLDAHGNNYQFSASNGCMYSQSSHEGPSGFCLTSSSAGGYAAYGATNCSNSTTNSYCDAASFHVVLTNDPLKSSGCIAVLVSGGSQSVTGPALAVTSVSGGFDVQTATPSAYTAYWNGTAPICGGSSEYAGSYVGTSTTSSSGSSSGSGGGSSGPTPVPTGCAPDFSSSSFTFTVDSGGIINDDSSKITGTITSGGTGSFTSPGGLTYINESCTVTVDITGATKNPSGKWVLSASFTGDALGNPFSATQE